MIDKLRYGDRIVQALRSAVSDGEAGLRDVPELIEKVIAEKLWRRRLVQSTNETVEFVTFSAFVEAAPPEGLGADVATLLRLCEKKPRVLDSIDRAIRTGHGGDRKRGRCALRQIEDEHKDFKHDIVILENIANATAGEHEQSGKDSCHAKIGYGNSKLYALRRLRQNHHELHEKVLAGEMSAHKAMTLAGFRRETITIPLEPERAARVLAQKFGRPELLHRLLTELTKQFAHFNKKPPNEHKE